MCYCNVVNVCVVISSTYKRAVQLQFLAIVVLQLHLYRVLLFRSARVSRAVAHVISRTDLQAI